MRTEIDNWKHVVVFVEDACVNGSPGCLLIRKPIIARMGRFSINTPLRSGRKNYQRPYQSRVRAFYWPLTRHFSVISQLESEKRVHGEVLDFWYKVTVGDLAFAILMDFFTDPTW